MPVKEGRTDIERVYHEWDAALSKNDMTALLSLYAPSAELESPLVSHLLEREDGVCRGREEPGGSSKSSPPESRKSGDSIGKAISPKGGKSCGSTRISRPTGNKWILSR